MPIHQWRSDLPGMVKMHLYPSALATRAKPTPVFPPVASTIVPPGLRRPSLALQRSSPLVRVRERLSSGAALPLRLLDHVHRRLILHTPARVEMLSLGQDPAARGSGKARDFWRAKPSQRAQEWLDARLRGLPMRGVLPTAPTKPSWTSSSGWEVGG
jgi:hypothetical protein